MNCKSIVPTTAGGHCLWVAMAVVCGFAANGGTVSIGELSASHNCVTNTGNVGLTADTVRTAEFTGQIDYLTFTVAESGRVQLDCTYKCSGGMIGSFFYDIVPLNEGGSYLRTSGSVFLDVVPKTKYVARLYAFSSDNKGYTWTAVMKFSPGKVSDGTGASSGGGTISVTNVVTIKKTITVTNTVTHHVTVTNYTSSSVMKGQVSDAVRSFLPISGFDGTTTALHNGIVCDKAGCFCGIVQISTGKSTTKGVKIGGFVMLEDGKKQSLKSKTAPIGDGFAQYEGKVGKLGSLALIIGKNGFRGILGEYTIVPFDLDGESGVLRGGLTLSYFDEKTGKLKTRKVTVAAVTADAVTVGTAAAKGKEQQNFSAICE